LKLAIFYQHIQKAAEESGKSVLEIMRALKEEGLTGVEFNILDVREPILLFLQSAGLTISSIYAYVPFFSGDTEEGIRLVDKAFSVGCRTVMVVPGNIPEGIEKTEVLQQSIMPLRQITEYGAKRGVTVTVEDYDGTRPLFSTSDDMLFFGEKIPALFYTYDSGNFYTVEDPLLALDALKKKITHVHLKDISHSPIGGSGEKRRVRSGDFVYDVPFGFGELPCADILKRLQEIDYSGYLCFEHNAKAMMDANFAAVRWTKKQISQ